MEAETTKCSKFHNGGRSQILSQNIEIDPKKQDCENIRQVHYTR